MERVHEGIAVSFLRPAVDFKDGWILFARLKINGLHYPCVYLNAVAGLNFEVLGLRDLVVLNPAVEIGKLFLLPVAADVELQRCNRF